MKIKMKLLMLCAALFMVVFANAQSGETLNFDGVDDYVELGIGLSNHFSGKKAVTVGAWVYSTSDVGIGAIVACHSNGNDQFWLRRNGDYYEFVLGFGTYGVLSPAGSVQLNQWQYMSGVYDGTNLKIYIDGNLEATTTVPSVYSLGSGSGIGYKIGATGFGEVFQGKIDEVSIWDRALCQAEIQNNMLGELDPTLQTGLIAYYQFNQGTAGDDNTAITTLNDVTGNGYDGTLTNFALTGFASNWVSPGAVAMGTTAPAPVQCPIITRTYVDSSNVSGVHDGLSWATAFNKFEDGVNVAQAGDSVFVAKGTYQPASGQSFSMKEDVKIYGGFDGTETSFSDRDWNANATVLKGNNNSVIKNDNNGLTTAAVLDGFTITDGYASNHGGGVYNENSSPTLTNVTISGNYTMGSGGGISNNNSSPTLSNVTISGNTASGDGGGICNNNSSPMLSNVTISGNSVSAFGGGIYIGNNSSPILKNTIVLGNRSGIEGGAIHASSSHNLIQTGNQTSESELDGVAQPYSVPSLVFVDPQAPAQTTAGDYSLLCFGHNAAINTGDNLLYTGDINTDKDLAGNNRFFGTNIDLGAYELQSAPSVTANDASLTVCEDTLGGNSGTFDLTTAQGSIHSNTGLTFTYYSDATHTTLISDSTTYTANDGNVVYVKVNDGACFDYAEIALNTKSQSVGTDIQSACDSLIWIDGNTYTSSNNTATYTLTNAAGCDSIITLNLTVVSINKTVTVSGSTLSANQNDATYQWVDCNNNQTPINGATSQTFTPTVTGDYAVIISNGSCEETSIWCVRHVLYL